MKQRNPEGGFISTQDTVVGIRALAKFAEAIQSQKNSEAEMSVDVVSSSESPEPDHTFVIGKDDLATLQEYILPLNFKEVELKAKGKGTALNQLTWSYYIETTDTAPAFSPTLM
jgi:CD109 antigen